LKFFARDVKTASNLCDLASVARVLELKRGTQLSLWHWLQPQRQGANRMLAEGVLTDQNVKTQYIITDFAKHLKAMLATLDYQP
jgi:hypothetical protein